MDVEVYKDLMDDFAAKCKELHISIADIKHIGTYTIVYDLNEAVDMQTVWELAKWYFTEEYNLFK